MAPKKSWQEKMEDKEDTPRLLILKKNFPCFSSLAKMGAKEGDSCVLVNPHDVENIMEKVPEGKLITLKEVCKKLAKKFGSDYCCPLTVGIYIMTAANAAEEMKIEGRENNNPYWRTLRMGGFLNPKFPGGQEAHKELLEKEGFKIETKGKKYKVIDYEKYLNQ